MSNYPFDVSVEGQGLYDITPQVAAAVTQSGVSDGLATVFIKHTSASLLIQENADPAVQVDLQKLVIALGAGAGCALYPHRGRPRRYARTHQGGADRGAGVGAGD